MFHTRTTGKEVEDITFTFKEGKVVKASLLSAPQRAPETF
jgi:leucyl aminopeptidase (aminopeptidase T)